MMGRPRIDGTGKKAHSVHLTAEHIATAKRLGDGNVSAGVRAALEIAAKVDWALNYIAPVHDVQEPSADRRGILRQMPSSKGD